MTATELLELRYSEDLRRSTVKVLLTLLLVWSCALRLWFATPELNSFRFWDERYGLENLEPLLKHGQLRPVHGFHPSFSYLPHGLLLKASDLVYETTGRQSFAIFDRSGRYTETAYLICRAVSVVFGTLSLLFVFLIGRRLGGDRLGLLAAFLAAVVPWHLRQSVMFKADIALVLTVVLTMYLSLRAIDRPSGRSYAVTGVAIGLALSSKFNAAPAAIPLTIGTLLGRGSRRRNFLWLVLAAVISAAVFVLLQPYIVIDPSIYRRSMGTTTRIYEAVARSEGHSRLYIFWHLVASLSTSSFHGPFIGVLAVVGLGLLLILSLRLLRSSSVALPWLMVLSYIVGYATLYAIATPRSSPHNWLPISPFAALGAAWAILAAWLWARQWLSTGRARRLATVGIALLVMVLGWRASLYVYRESVPRTSDLALGLLRSRLGQPEGRLVFTEHDFKILFYHRHNQGRLAVRLFPRLDELDPTTLDRSDAEVFPAGVLEDPLRGDFYRQRMDAVKPRQVGIFEPRLFHAWGPALYVLLHPLKNTGQWRGNWIQSTTDPRRYTAELPARLEGEPLLSIGFRVPNRTEVTGLEAGSQAAESIAYHGPRRQIPITTTRFPYERRLVLEISRNDGRPRIPFTIRSWRPLRRDPARQQGNDSG